VAAPATPAHAARVRPLPAPSASSRPRPKTTRIVARSASDDSRRPTISRPSKRSRPTAPATAFVALSGNVPYTSAEPDSVRYGFSGDRTDRYSRTLDGSRTLPATSDR
jgi:hypothetical protein